MSDSEDVTEATGPETESSTDETPKEEMVTSKAADETAKEEPASSEVSDETAKEEGVSSETVPPGEETPKEDVASCEAKPPAEETPKKEPASSEATDETSKEEPASFEAADETPKEEPASSEATAETPKEGPASSEAADETLKEPVSSEAADETPKEEPASSEAADETPKEEPASSEAADETPKEEPASSEAADETPKEEAMDEPTPELEPPADAMDNDPSEPPSTLAGAMARKHKKKKKVSKPQPVAPPKEELKKGGRWTVNHENCKAALLALPTKTPRCITLFTKPNEAETLPQETLVAFAQGAKSCDVWLRFLDSYLNPTDPAKDLQRLELFLANDSLTITQFFGHLDASGISKLPDTITNLGLAVGCAEDAAALAQLTPWEELLDIRISVNVDVDILSLKPLPGDIKKSLYLPGMTDEKVGLVRGVVEALLPNGGLSRLMFPLSQLSADGARLLSHMLCVVVKITDGVAIEPSGAWRPDKKEAKSIEADFFNALGCGLGWSMKWLYGKT